MRTSAATPTASAAPAAERIAVPIPGGGSASVLLHRPAERPPVGSVLLVPSGSWSAREPRGDDAIARTASDRGFVVAALRGPAEDDRAGVPARAAAAALAWLRAGGSGADTPVERVGAIGEGTGANVLAALASDPATRPDAAVLVSGIYDVPAALASGDPGLELAVVRDRLGVQFLQTAADPQVSPARADLAGFPPAYLLCDTDHPWREQTLVMTEALAAASSPVTCALADPATTPRAVALARALDWLERTLASPPPRIGDPAHPVTIALAGPPPA